MFPKCFFAFLLTVLFLVGGFAQEIALTEEEQNWLDEHPVIRVGVGTNYPPIQYVSEVDGELQFLGIASDYLEILSALLGIEFRVEYGITFNEAMARAERKEIDMLPCVAYNSVRDEFLEFTAGYLENPLVIFSNDNAPFIGSVKDLSGLKVADVEAFYTYKLLNDSVSGIKYILQKDAEACLESVAFGRADANVAGLISGSYLIRKNNWTNIKVAAPTDFPDTVFRMAVREDWPELRTILDKVLLEVDHERKNAINQKWIAVRYEHGIRRSDLIIRILLVVVISAAAILITLAWVIRLLREIRQRKTAENEKELLLREVYHRVKNNLNLVNGLVSMQAAELSTPEDADKMKMVTQKINSIVLLHEKLSLAPDLKHIELSDYISELIKNIESTLTGHQTNLKIKSQVAGGIMNEKKIIPLGLIITELVTNALKYGYESEDQGVIEIILEKTSIDCYILIVKNDGAPMPEAAKSSNPKSLGMMLIENLVVQLEGGLEIKRSPSPEFRISFCASDKVTNSEYLRH